MSTEVQYLHAEDFPIRRMSADDMAAVMSNERAAYPIPWREGVMRDCFQAGYACRVIDGPAGVIGHGIISLAAGEAHVLNLCVHPRWQGKGLGRIMLRHLLDHATENAVDMVFLEVREGNSKAIALYESMGFQQLGVRPGYYPGEKQGSHRGREDAWVYGLALGLGD